MDSEQKEIRIILTGELEAAERLCEHLRAQEEMIREKDTYGILLVDSSAATLATLQGRRLKIVREMTSGVPGKTRAGGQSARRYERLREMRLQEYFTRVGEHANGMFLPVEDLKGLIIASIFFIISSFNYRRLGKCFCKAGNFYPHLLNFLNGINITK